jgi:hypothetical protein
MSEQNRPQQRVVFSSISGWKATLNLTGRASSYVVLQVPCPHCEFKFSSIDPYAAVYGMRIHGIREHKGMPMQEDLIKNGFGFAFESSSAPVEKPKKPQLRIYGCQQPGCEGRYFDSTSKLINHAKIKHPERAGELKTWMQMLGRDLNDDKEGI